MEVKLFEFRDRATFVPVMCTRLEWSTPEEHYIFRRAGYTNDGMTRANDVPPYIMCTKLTDTKSAYDPYDWDNRTMQVAHHHVTEHWDEVRTGDVIDVEYILGETTTKKISERLGGL